MSYIAKTEFYTSKNHRYIVGDDVPDNELNSVIRNLCMVRYVKDQPKYVVFFEPNGGTGEVGDIPCISTTGKFILPQCTFGSPEHMKFVGWSECRLPYSEISTPVVAGGVSYTVSETPVTMYAIWDNITHEVSFDGGKATGSMKAQTVNEGETLDVPKCSFTYAGHHFAGWTLPDGSLVQPASTFEVLTDMVLKAKWEKDPKPKTPEVKTEKKA